MSLDELLAESAPALLVGLGAANRAVAAALVRRGHAVSVIDDRADDTIRAAAEALGAVFVSGADSPADTEALLGGVGFMVPTPGLPETHRAFAAADSAKLPVVSELDLAALWDQRPILAVTGTNGKTTVVELAVAGLRAAGRATAAAGNTDTPLVAAIDDVGPELFVVEASSFRLARAARFAPLVGAWLNFAPDHLDVHRDLASYEAAKARLFELSRVAVVANAADPVTMAHAERAARRGLQLVSFGSGGQWFERDGELWGPDGPFASTSELWRSLPHDISDTLAAAATLAVLGVEPEALAVAAATFSGLAHRVSEAGEIDGVAFYDDSKATTPHATVAALQGFERAVLIAGGRNKGIDLSQLRSGSARISAVVAIGEAAPEIRALFEPTHVVRVAADMADAVRQAHALADARTPVLLSPACASFDWYCGYGQRGDDFVRSVADLAADLAADPAAGQSAEVAAQPEAERGAKGAR